MVDGWMIYLFINLIFWRFIFICFFLYLFELFCLEGDLLRWWLFVVVFNVVIFWSGVWVFFFLDRIINLKLLVVFCFLCNVEKVFGEFIVMLYFVLLGILRCLICVVMFLLNVWWSGVWIWLINMCLLVFGYDINKFKFGVEVIFVWNLKWWNFLF